MEKKALKPVIKGQDGLAEYLGVHFQTIIRWRKSGKLNYKKVGQTYFFDPENLWAENKKQSPRKK